MVGSDEGSQRGEDDGQLTLDEVCEILGNRRRRNVLLWLRAQTGRAVSVADIVEEVQRHEQYAPGEGPSRSEIRTALSHLHVPKLQDVGVIAYDERDQTCRYQANETLDAWLNFVETEHESELW